MLALLIPEDSIPVSAIDGLCHTIGSDLFNSKINEPLLALILDKCEAETFRHESLWHYCVANDSAGVPLIQRLLDGVENIEISEELLEALGIREEDMEQEEDADTAAMILFERGNVEITERFVNRLCWRLLRIGGASWYFQRMPWSLPCLAVT